MTIKQASGQIRIQTPLGEDALLLRSFYGQESLSRLFEFDLEFASENPSISYDDIVGHPVTITVTLADGSERYWNGCINRFVQMHRNTIAASYRATMVPWVWFLSQTTDCRIFQNKTVPDLLKQIFKENGYSDSDFAFRLYGDFAPRDYCVQYRESDLNFVSRLMEEEGIFYFFVHDKGKHVLVMGNDPAAFKPCPSQSKARFNNIAGGWKDEDVITEWSQEREFRPGVYSATDYNFETPGLSLLSTAKGKTKYELYDYPGDFAKRADGDRVVRTRLEEFQMPQLVGRGRSTCRAFTVGDKFSLDEHFRDDLNKEYVITGLRHAGRYDMAYSSGPQPADAPVYENSFECVPASTPVRPTRITPVPTVQGCHTAVVVGPAGEEIFADKYGRVKVQFHWDREGKKNENSSCWVRVSYPTAGKAWGAIQIPRIGQEVIVDFIEGDPDRPIITGRTYNAAQMPPWELPGKGMVSGFKSNSTKGGGGYNEFAFDDTKGNELIRVHGQYDMDTVIEHDERRHVVNNRTKKVDANEETIIGVDRKEKVGSNETIHIGANRNETVDGHELIKVKLTRTRNVGVNEMVNVLGAQEITVGGVQTVSVVGARLKTVGAGEVATIIGNQKIKVVNDQSLGVGGAQKCTIVGDQTTSIKSGQTISITSDLKETIGGSHTEAVKADRTTNVDRNDVIKVGRAFALEAADQISFTAGDASIVMKKDGTIIIQGKNITIKGSGKINAEASGELTLKGSKIQQN